LQKHGKLSQLLTEEEVRGKRKAMLAVMDTFAKEYPKGN